MAISITHPHGERSSVSPNQRVHFKADVTSPDKAANLVWDAKVNAGSFSTFASGSDEAIYQIPSSVSNADGSGNKGVYTITIKARDRSTGNSDEVELVLVQGIPALKDTIAAPPVTSRASDKATCSEATNHTEWQAMSDPDLRDAAIQTGPLHEEAWRELVRRYGPRISSAVVATLTRLTRRPRIELNEELVQASWVHIAAAGNRTLRAWNPVRGDLGNFLARVGMWEVLLWHRRSLCRKEVCLDEQQLRKLENQPDIELGPEDVATLTELESLLQRWESALTPVERHLLKLKAAGKSIREIARRLNMSRMALERLLHRMEAEVKQLLIADSVNSPTLTFGNPGTNRNAPVKLEFRHFGDG